MDIDEQEYAEDTAPELERYVPSLPSLEVESDTLEAFGGALISNVPFPPDVPSFLSTWKKVGYLDMSDPTQQCPAPWSKISSPRASCGKKSIGGACDSLTVGTFGASYGTVCGRFRGYQVGSPDAFNRGGSSTLETNYVDGISITYGAPGSRQHIFTYAAACSF